MTDTTDAPNYTDRYNTSLSPQEEQQFQNWTTTQSKAVGRNISGDLSNYDLRGLWKDSSGADLQGEGTETYGEKFKKPNHPTFSTFSKYHGVDGNEGGIWDQRGDGSWFFTPGASNLKNFGYFAPGTFASRLAASGPAADIEDRRAESLLSRVRSYLTDRFAPRPTNPIPTQPSGLSVDAGFNDIEGSISRIAEQRSAEQLVRGLGRSAAESEINSDRWHRETKALQRRVIRGGMSDIIRRNNNGS
jgi:hypothetical protein